MSDLGAVEFLKELAGHLDPVAAFERALGFQTDSWQKDLLTATDDLILCMCSRGVGKSMTAAVLGHHFADTTPHATVVLVAPALRQSSELYRYCCSVKDKLPLSALAERETQSEMELDNKARLIVLPGSSEDTIRAYRANLIIADEAARLSHEVIGALIPMLVAGGRMIMLSTPKGRDNFFAEAWLEGRGRRIIARSTEMPRMTQIVSRDRKIMSAAAFRTEHELFFAGSGDTFFDFEMVKAAFVDKPALRLACLAS